MSRTWVTFMLGVVAGSGLVLVVLNVRGMWRTRPERHPRLGRRSTEVIGAEAEQWLAQNGDHREPRAGVWCAPMGEHLFDRECIDCRAVVTFPGLPGDATCGQCGLKMYLVGGGIGRYPSAESFMGGIQGRKQIQDHGRRWHPARGPQDLGEAGAGRQPGRIQGRRV
jgi:hypothetical protein